MFPPVAIEHIPSNNLSSPQRLSYSPERPHIHSPMPPHHAQFTMRNENIDVTRTLVHHSIKGSFGGESR